MCTKQIIMDESDTGLVQINGKWMLLVDLTKPAQLVHECIRKYNFLDEADWSDERVARFIKKDAEWWFGDQMGELLADSMDSWLELDKS